MRRICEGDREVIALFVDGRSVAAQRGDTVLTAILVNVGRLRTSDVSGEPRAGFCLMGACQDCWVATEAGDRLRACTTFAEPAMRLVTGAVR